jgi:hypothetical protein
MAQDPYFGKFIGHAKRAARRGIPFLLTYSEWLRIWIDSGHLDERGPYRGQYVMARFGDKGPYAVGNVKIVTVEANVSEGRSGKIHSEASRRRMSIAKLGNTNSKGHIKSQRTRRLSSIAMLGNKHNIGRVHSAETKRLMGVAQKLRYRREGGDHPFKRLGR